MNPRLLRPLATIDPVAVAWRSAVIAAGSSVDGGVVNAVSRFAKGCKADGIWDAMKSVVLLAGAETLDGAIVPVKGLAPTAYNAANALYSKTSGLKGDGSTFYLDSNRNNNADPQNSKHASVYATALPASGSNEFPRMLSSGNSSSQDTMLHRNQNAGALIVNCNASSFDTPAATAGFLGVSRSLSGQYNFRGNGITTLFNRNSGTPRDADIFLYNDPSLPANGFADARLAFYSIGESLDLALLDARVSALMTDLGVS
jgi:hypothetical protein